MTAAGALADFDFVVDAIREGYAGYPRAVRGRGAELAAWTARLRRRAAAAAWTAFFRDGHLRVAAGDAATIAGEPPEPSLRFLEGGAAHLRVPSFELHQHRTIEALVAADGGRLFRAPALVLDLRGNRGGADASFLPLLPLLQDGPVRQAGVEVRASAHSVRYFRELAEDPEVPAGARPFLRTFASRLERAAGGFVPISPNRVLDAAPVPAAPPRVAIVIDARVASSAEELLLLARQSPRVTVLGATPTAGVLDHANVAALALPSGAGTLHLPTSRTTRPPEAAVDGRGIAPDVLVPPGEDLVAAALALLAG